MPTTLIIVLAVIALVEVVLCGVLWWAFHHPAVPTQDVLAAPVSRTPPPPTKCHIVTFVYADGEQRTVHSICESDGQPHTDAYGQALRPGVPLIETRGDVHLLRSKS